MGGGKVGEDREGLGKEREVGQGTVGEWQGKIWKDRNGLWNGRGREGRRGNVWGKLGKDRKR